MVQPRVIALLHDTSELIDAYSQDGYSTGCGEDWAVDQMEAALQIRTYPSSDTEDAMKALHNETRGKVVNGYAKIIRYGELEKTFRQRYKISPMAMIPHKSRSYHKSFDFSFQLLKKGRIISRHASLKTLIEADLSTIQFRIIKMEEWGKLHTTYQQAES